MLETTRALDSLRKLVLAEREQYKEKLAAGHANAPEIVGRCKALEWVAQRIAEQIKSANQGADDGDDPS